MTYLVISIDSVFNRPHKHHIWCKSTECRLLHCLEQKREIPRNLSTISFIRNSEKKFEAESESLSCRGRRIFPPTEVNGNNLWVFFNDQQRLVYVRVDNNTLKFTASELILCFTICVLSATRHNIHISYIVYISASDIFPLGHVRYINILTWLRGFQVKIIIIIILFLL